MTPQPSHHLCAVLALASTLGACASEHQTQHTRMANSNERPPIATERFMLALDDGARLRVPVPAGTQPPKGAIRFERIACEAGALAGQIDGCVYRVKLAEGTAAGRLTLELPASDAASPCILAHTRTGWGCLGDSSRTADAVQATFSQLEIIAAVKRSDATSAWHEACVDPPPIVPCGGDLLGSWRLVEACGVHPGVILAPSADSPYAACSEGEHITTLTAEHNETLTFTDTLNDPNSVGDGSLRTSESSTTRTYTRTTAACMETAQQTCGPPDRCELSDGACSCTHPFGNSGGGSGGSWGTIGHTLYMNTPPGQGPGTLYCVRGDTLTLSSPNGGSRSVYQRQ